MTSLIESHARFTELMPGNPRNKVCACNDCLLSAFVLRLLSFVLLSSLSQSHSLLSYFPFVSALVVIRSRRRVVCCMRCAWRALLCAAQQNSTRVSSSHFFAFCDRSSMMFSLLSRNCFANSPPLSLCVCCVILSASFVSFFFLSRTYNISLHVGNCVANGGLSLSACWTCSFVFFCAFLVCLF